MQVNQRDGGRKRKKEGSCFSNGWKEEGKRRGAIGMGKKWWIPMGEGGVR